MQSNALQSLSSVAINANPLPLALIDALDGGEWMDMSSAGGRVLGKRFGVRTLYPEFYDYVKIVRATDFFASPEAAAYWPGGLDASLDIDPARAVLIGDIVGAGEDFLTLDYRTDPATVRLLTDVGWEHVASSIPELFDQLDERR